MVRRQPSPSEASTTASALGVKPDRQNRGLTSRWQFSPLVVACRCKPPGRGFLDSENCSGNPRGPYAPSRERARFSSEFISALLRDFRQGGPAAIAKVRKYQPDAYMKICAFLVPKEMKLEHSGGVKAMTDEEIERAIEFIKAMIAKQEAGASAKVIEGVAEPVPALPPPSRKARRKVRRSDRADSGLAARVVDAEPTDEVRQPPRDQVSPSKSP